MKNPSEQIDYSNPESVNLEEFFRFKNGEGDNYSETEQKLLYKYIEQMKELKKELGVKSFKELEEPDFTKGKDLKVIIVPMRKLNAVMEKIDEAMREHKFEGLTEIVGETENGNVIIFEIPKLLEQWKKFYEMHDINWVELPKKIIINMEMLEKMARVIKELAPEKAEDIEILIIPEGLADDGDKYEALHKEMTRGYGKSLQYEKFTKDGGFKGLKNKSDGLRIIITKKIEDMYYDKILKETLEKSVDELEGGGGIFKQKGLRGMDMATYLVFQKKYFEETNQHLQNWIWITEQWRHATGDLVPYVLPVDLFDHLSFNSNDRNFQYNAMGCRLAGSFEIES